MNSVKGQELSTNIATLNVEPSLFETCSIKSALIASSAIQTTDDNDTLSGDYNNNRFGSSKGDDAFTGGGGQDRFVIGLGDGTKTITDFGGIGRGANPSDQVVAEVDTLQFVGAGLTATNLLLNQKGADLEVTFFGVKDSPTVILKNFSLEKLDNLSRSTGGSVNLGNILFEGQTYFQDSFDVFNADAQPNVVFNRNTTTFLNDLNNQTNGFDHSADVINALGGDDSVHGFGGDDWIRGGLGKDTIDGGDGNDWIQGDAGQDTLTGSKGYDRFIFDKFAIESTAFNRSPVGIRVNTLPPDLVLDFNQSEDQFGLSSNLGLHDLQFASGRSNEIFGNRNVIVLQDGFANAAAAANAIAQNDAITADQGVFVYFNTTLGISRLVHSTDLSDGGDISVLANLTNQTKIEGQAGFNSQNFTLV